MIMSKFIIAFVAVLAVANARCPKYNIQVFTRTSANANGLQRIVDSFGKELGGENNGNSPGPLPDGQRSVNWDAPGSVLPFDMPFDFFDKTVTRGIVFQAAGNKFAVSNPSPAPPADDDRFSSLIGKRQSLQFDRFSKPRLFTPVKSNVLSATFRIPAKNRGASTAGFGAVFADVDQFRHTYMDFIDRKGCFIGRLFIPPKNKGLSFGGIIVKGKKHEKLPVIWKVVMRLGNVSIQRFAKHPPRGADVVVLDDLIYGEPQ